jgi:type II secretory pathway component PulF
MSSVPAATQPTSTQSFAYEAQTADGEPMTGTIDAPDVEHATRQLQALRLRVVRIEPVSRPRRSAPLRGDDFIAFNQQLSQLTAAGLPVEQGLRLIAQDMRSGRLAATVEQVAAELERGTPLGEAFDKHRAKFPPLYGRLIEAGVRAHNLPGILLNLGRHLELVSRIRAMLWRAMSYPLMVLIGLMIVLLFLTTSVIPQFEQTFRDFGIKLPVITQLMLSSAYWLPPLLIALIGLIVVPIVLWPILRASGWSGPIVEHVLLHFPLIGTVLRRNLVARWCDALRIGVEAGLDLPAAIALAGDAVGSSKLRDDGQRLVGALESGVPLEAGRPTRLIPHTVVAALELAQSHHDLPTTLATLSQMYQQQAETRLGMIPAILTPLLLILTALVIGFVVLALFAPFLSLLRAISG